MTTAYKRRVQPPQCQPVPFDPDMIDRAHILYYDAGRTQAEVGAALGVAQKSIWKLMTRHGWERRPAVKREQRGPNNANWGYGGVTYAALHKRVERARGLAKDGACRCGVTAIDWANLTGRYDDINDYERMCRPCHRAYDGRERDEKGRYK